MMRHMLGCVVRVLAPLIALALLVTSCGSSTATLSGTDLGNGAAPDFTLTDGVTGKSLTLSSLRGSVVALAFLYTRCPDVCPLTAAEFRAAQRALGADASRVEFVAVSVDPDGDTPAAVKDFSDAHDLRDHWHYLIGPRAQLQAVWQSYGVGAIVSAAGKGVEHNDAKGRERVLNHSNDPANTLIENLRALLKEG